MPILAKTMRDLWDQDRKNKKEKFIKSMGMPEEMEFFKAEQTGEIQSYFLDYVARKQAFLCHKDEIAKIFSDYRSRLDQAGFLKIN